uniref:Uncharacterized protein n=1 Tax=Coccidioides posadasii RMSCC 3488 TaxID=454284 RepID=A0A0J6I8K8_COCPO|nr:hypothetical protein CPAG_04180 [Coccidioides posadasii RMSCC 3488]
MPIFGWNAARGNGNTQERCPFAPKKQETGQKHNTTSLIDPAEKQYIQTLPWIFKTHLPGVLKKSNTVIDNRISALCCCCAPFPYPKMQLDKSTRAREHPMHEGFSHGPKNG